MGLLKKYDQNSHESSEERINKYIKKEERQNQRSSRCLREQNNNNITYNVSIGVILEKYSLERGKT